MMRNYFVKEWERLPHGDGDVEIPPHFAELLVAQSRLSSFSQGVLEDRRRELRARGVVGIIAARECCLEILPKIDVGHESNTVGEIGEVRKRLVHMISVAHDLKIETGMISEIDWQRDTLLEILIRLFHEKLFESVRRGLPRRYVHREDDLRTLRGSLDTVRQYTRHAANPERLACRFDELSDDIALNRVMKATVAHLSTMSRSTENLRHLRELAFIYADIAHVPIPELAWDEVVIDRTNRAWRELFEMARMFLGYHYQTTSLGQGNGTSMLFEMNELFEEYIARMAKRALMDTEFQVSAQGGGEFCLTSVDDRRKAFKTKPDILIRDRGLVALVIDTKWKRISKSLDDPKWDVSQSDVYQIMAYAQVYETPRVMLLYPHHTGLGADDGIQARFHITGHGAILDIASVDITVGPKEIKSRLREFILLATDLSPGNVPLHVDAHVE